MKRSNLFLLALAFCLLTSVSIRGQSTGYTANSGGSTTSYGSSTPSYGGSTPSYGGSTPSYGGSTPSYGSSTPSYGSNSSYGGSTPSYGGSTPSYGSNTSYGGGSTPSYGGSTPSYGGSTPSYGSSTPSYGTPSYGGGYTHEEEEEYYYEEEEYYSQNYNYNSPSYGGSSSASYGQGSSSSGYGSSQGYSGSYDSSSSSSTPKFPTSLLTGFVVDIHIIAVDITLQYVAYHYCSDLMPGYTQCAIYNGTDSNSRIVATEQIVTAEILATLPLEERKLYHSHAYSVKNGLLVIPGLSGDQELQTMQGVMSTYGKVVDYWHPTQNFPIGVPKLAYGLAADWQLNNDIINEMDQSLNVGTTWLQRKQQRASLTMPTIIEGANDYLTSGEYPQYVIQKFKVPSHN